MLYYKPAFRSCVPANFLPLLRMILYTSWPWITLFQKKSQFRTDCNNLNSIFRPDPVMLLFPHKDQRHMFYCLNLDAPIKQGQNLSSSSCRRRTRSLELPFKEEELEKKMRGPTFHIWERGGEGKEEDKVARTIKKVDVCLLPVAQLRAEKRSRSTPVFIIFTFNCFAS